MGVGKVVVTGAEPGPVSPDSIDSSSRSCALDQIFENQWSLGQVDLLQSLVELESRSPLLAHYGCADSLQDLITSGRGQLSPWVFLTYYLCGRLILSGKVTDPELRQFAAALQEAIHEPIRDNPLVVGFGAEGYRQEWWDWLDAVFKEGGDLNDPLESPPPAILRDLESMVARARAFITEVDPALARKLNRLQSLIIVANPQGRFSGAAPKGFGGATTFFFRGGSLFSGRTPYSLVSMVDRIIHEASHAELFVLGQLEPLCLNDDDERHPVTIRPDPRPMNGIIHAYYVSIIVARFCHNAIRQITLTSSSETGLLAELHRTAKQNQGHGASCRTVIKRFARLTDLGTSLLTHMDALADTLEPIT